MHALVVIAHPRPDSLTHAIAARLADGVTEGDAHSVEIADLSAEGFDPRFNPSDIAVHLKAGDLSADIVAEQVRIDRADALVLVFPVYWWSFPAILKGWIDRVFSNGWAYDWSEETGLVKKLQRLPVHIVALGGADTRTYARHGYYGSMKNQIDHGIFGYCGAPVDTSELLIDGDTEAYFDIARRIGGGIFSRDARSAAA